MNRSVSIIGKKLDTQFLDDTSYEIKETFVTPLPSTLGLPDDGSTYEVAQYSVFLHYKIMISYVVHCFSRSQAKFFRSSSAAT